MKNVIFGTDWHSDVDDVVAMRILARAHKDKKINLLGAVINSCSPNAVRSLDGFLSTENVFIPIGIDLSATIFPIKAKYQDRLALRATRFTANEQAEDGVKLYRKLIAESQEKVHVVEVGFLQVVASVLQSGPDEISSKDGMTLFREKVEKVWVMAGKWDEDGGKEFNFSNHPIVRCASNFFCANCPVPVTFLGFEVGVDVITPLPPREDDPLRLAMLDYHVKNGHSSWDPLTAHLAVVGDEEKAGYDVVQGKAHVDADTGRNYFTVQENGPHQYVVKKFPSSYYEKIMEEATK